MFDNDEAVAMGDGTISNTTGKVFVDDGMGGFCKSPEKPHPWFDAIRNARPPRRRIPLRACGVTRRVVATRSTRVTTSCRTKRHKSSTRSTAGSSAGSDLSGDKPGNPPRSLLQVEYGHLTAPAVAEDKIAPGGPVVTDHYLDTATEHVTDKSHQETLRTHGGGK